MQHFPIEGMTCDNCVRHVEKAFNNLNGILKHEVHLEKNQALVEYDSSLLSYERMKAALKDAGYTLGNPID